MRILLSLFAPFIAIAAGFPPEGGYVNARLQYEAKGDGVSDATTAFSRRRRTM